MKKKRSISEKLSEIGIEINKEYLEKLKKKKRKKKLKQGNTSFEERVRVDLETVNKIIAIGKAYKEKERVRTEKELLQAREEREKSGGQKDKEREKGKGERLKSSGGRSRDSRH